MTQLQFSQRADDVLNLRADLVELLFGLVNDKEKLASVESRLMEILMDSLPRGDDKSVAPYLHATLVALARGDLRFNDVNDAIYSAILKAPFGSVQVTRCLMD